MKLIYAMNKKAGKYWSKKAEAPATPLPERGYLSNIAVNKERKALSIFRINPLAVLIDYVAAKHSNLATFFLQTIFHKSTPFCSLGLADSRQGASCVVPTTFAGLQQLSPKLTGQRALSFPMEEKKGRKWDCCKFQNSLKGAFTPDSLRCKYTTEYRKLYFSLTEIGIFAYIYNRILEN